MSAYPRQNCHQILQSVYPFQRERQAVQRKAEYVSIMKKFTHMSDSWQRKCCSKELNIAH